MFNVDPSYDWVTGKYDIQVALDFKTVNCRGELPLHTCEEGPSFTCDDPSVVIIESGCALPKSQQGIGGLQIADSPKKIMVRIARNNKTIVTRTVIPQYQTSMPNGPGCGPVCHSATFDLLSAQ